MVRWGKKENDKYVETFNCPHAHKTETQAHGCATSQRMLERDRLKYPTWDYRVVHLVEQE